MRLLRPRQFSDAYFEQAFGIASIYSVVSMSDRTHSYDRNMRRQHVCQVLDLLADANKQLQYQRDVPHVEVSIELPSLWFDDTYHPESSGFQEAFSRPELQALARFSDTFDHALEALGRPVPPIDEIQSHPSWKRMAAMATAVLDRIRGDSGPDLPNE